MSDLADADLAELLKLLEAEARARGRRAIDLLFPDTGPLRRELYPKHLAFIAAGATRRERCMLAGNRVGKSTTAAYEVTCHLTGDYPHWWTGKRFSHATTCWAAGESVRDVRDSAQKLLLGDPGSLGTGLIPGDAIIRATARSGAPDAIDTVHVRHATGGTSTLAFRTYESGREAFQAATLHCIWLDEEPQLAIYTEALMRTATTAGVVMCTFTPLLGMSETATHFLPDGKAPEGNATGPYTCFVEWSDVPHLTDQAKAELLQSIPPHLRGARTRGVPALGSGALYPIDELDVVCEPFEFPPWYRHCYALDVGWNRTAAIWAAIDPETDVAFLYSEHYRSQAEPAVHAQAIQARGRWIPGVIDPASRGRSQNDGQQLLSIYSQLGLTLVTADNAVEAGIYNVWTRLSTGRLKVFSTLQNWRAEFRIYRRDERGKIVKANDHLMDCSRYLCASGISLAQQRPADQWRGRPGMPGPREAANYGDNYKPYGAAWSVTTPQPMSHIWKGIGGRNGP
jgi:phage terminase large subunit-like protein